MVSYSTRNWKRRQKRRQAIKCPIIGCSALGFHSCSAEYGYQYSGKDSDLLMCDTHFAQLMPVYRAYKDIEKGLDFILKQDIQKSMAK